MSKRYGISEDGTKFSYGSLDRGGEVSNPRNINFKSRKMLSSRVSTRNNVWMSRRSGRWNEGEFELQMVPTLLKENIRLFTTQDPDEVGRFYMREDTFYNRDKSPEYALSVSPEIYQQMMSEINYAQTWPLGLYFCCHGGDGAHTGVAHEDFVDIHVAWIIVSIMMFIIIILSAAFISVNPT